MKHFYKPIIGCLLGLAATSFSFAQTTIDFESETKGDYTELPGVSQATISRSGFDFTAISSVASGIYYGFERDNPSTYPTSIGYNSIYLYMANLNGDPLTEIDITRTGGGLFDFDKIRLSPISAYATYDVPYDAIVQGFKNGVAVTAKVSLSTVIHGVGGYADAVDFDLTGDATFKGIDKVAITASIDNDYTALDNVVLTPVDVTPVSITGFSGNLSGGIANFSWNSGVEANFSHYTLEKSLDGKTFSAVKEIAAKGSNQTYQASTIQQEANAYYRLKLVEQTGDFSYYENVLTLDSKTGVTINLYPNPANDYIKVSAPEKGELLIYDAAGKVVLSSQLAAGETRVNIASLSAGIYYAIYKGQKISFVKH